ncbi:hypothetical protein [Mycolicibacterium litorale]|uniref:hypothetical protein n=1 Tax=Mycolicibacterium litorale TaxID=758802 RepID=UPI0039A37345
MGFSRGIVTVGQGTGEQLTFTGSNAAAVNSPATWRKTNGLNDQGTVQGEVRPDGTVRIVFSDAGSTVPFDGRVNPDGSVTGTRPGGDTPVPWDARITCVTQAPKAGPTISFDPVIGGLVAHITDRSGVTSQCEYRSDFYTRTFRLEANSTFDLRIVPAIPEFRDRPVDITCDNGTETHTSTFF